MVLIAATTDITRGVLAKFKCGTFCLGTIAPAETSVFILLRIILGYGLPFGVTVLIGILMPNEV